MSLNAFFFFAAGILSELLLLMDSARPAKVQWRTHLFAHSWSPAQILTAVMLGVAGTLAGICKLTGVGEMLVYINTPVINMFFVALGVAVFFAAIASNLFLPPANEQSILLVQCLLLAGNLWGRNNLAWLPAWLPVVIPAALCVLLAAWRRAFPGWLKVMIYTWYLFTLLITPFQSGETIYFHMREFTFIEAYSFGFLFIFLIVHGLFAARFLLIVPSSIVPRNRPLIGAAMARVFSDEQVPLRRFLVAGGLATAVLLGNEVIHVIDRPVALSLGMLIAVQVLRAPDGGSARFYEHPVRAKKMKTL